MEKESFRVIFSGKLVAGRNPKQVRVNLARLFNIDFDNPRDLFKLEKLFSGKPVVVKAGLCEVDAEKYRSVLAKAGAICILKAEGQAATATPAEGQPERRNLHRRKRGDRRSVRRGSAILPDRRKNHGRRNVDPNER